MSDLIKREDAIDAVIEWYGCKPNDIEAFEKIIEAIPSADRPTAEWFVFDGESDLYVDIKCSYCQKVYTVDSYKRDDIGFTIEDLKFCPNCGARMKGADDETN